jgi:HK97 family phage major capsid protein
MRKKILEQRKQRLSDNIAKLTERMKSSTDVNEVRDLTEKLEDLNAELKETQAEIDAIDEEERAQKTEEEKRATAPATLENAQILGAFAQPANETKRDEDPTSSLEYRQAFMKYVQKGEPMQLRNGEAISTADTGAAIPMTVMNEVINTVRKRYGNLYSRVRKMSVPGGVQISVGALKAQFKWINESTVSPRQKTDPLEPIIFNYNTAEIRVAQTFLSSILTLSAFEAELTRIIAIAYLEAMDKAIMLGSGNGSPLGVLVDPRVVNTITLTAADISNWTTWRKKFFSKLPLGYREGEFVFAASTVDAYLETMADSNNNPIFRQATGLVVNDGDSRDPNGRFFGREIALVEPDIITDFDTASPGDVIGLFWQPFEYALNENFGFTMRRYFDEETDEWVDKALTVVDGKTLNPTGFYKILKG